MERGTVGTVTDLAGTVDGSPVALIYGTNTITTPGIGIIGTLTVTVNLVDTQSAITDTIMGTVFDVGAPVPVGDTLPVRFGMSTLMMSSIVWMVITVLICAAVYKVTSGGGSGASGTIVMLIFSLCMIVGAVFGLLPVLVPVLLFIGYVFFIGYSLFFKHASV